MEGLCTCFQVSSYVEVDGRACTCLQSLLTMRFCIPITAFAAQARSRGRNAGAEIVPVVAQMDNEGRSSLEDSHVEGRGGILIDEYGIPLNESSSSSEIMARIPPLVFSARKKQWMRVMTEYSIPASKAEAWARDYDDVHTLVASVEHGTLSGSVLAARLHECDSGVFHVLTQLCVWLIQKIYGCYIRGR